MAKNTVKSSKGKIKTHKATAKRFDVKRSKKGGKTNVTILKRTDGQGHFNSRESGKVGRNKKRDNSVAQADHQTILRSIPYA